MQGCKSAVGRTSATRGAVHKSAEWLQFVYLIKYHFIEMHGAWGWGQRFAEALGCVLGGCADGVQGTETHAFLWLLQAFQTQVSAPLKAADSFEFFKQGRVNI